MPFVLADGWVRNTVQIHVVNKTDGVQRFELSGDGDLDYIVPMGELELSAGEGRHIPVIVRVPEDEMRPGLQTHIRISPEGAESRVLEALFLGPARGQGGSR